jgi:hypothetical protein
MSAMEYYPREQRHPTTHLASVGLSITHWQVESEYQKSASGLSTESPSIYILSDPPAPPAPLAVSHLSACTTAPPVLSEESRLLAESINGSPCTIPGDSSTEVTHGTHEWEYVCSVRRLSASTDSNNSECGITEEWAQASCDPAMRTRGDENEPESWALSRRRSHAVARRSSVGSHSRGFRPSCSRGHPPLYARPSARCTEDVAGTIAEVRA